MRFVRHQKTELKREEKIVHRQQCHLRGSSSSLDNITFWAHKGGKTQLPQASIWSTLLESRLLAASALTNRSHASSSGHSQKPHAESPNVTKLRSGLCYRQSVCLSVGRLSSVVCNVGAPYSGGWNFRQYFFTAVYCGHPLTSVQNFTEIVSGEPLRRGRQTQEG